MFVAVLAAAVAASPGIWVQELGCWVLEPAAVGDPWTAPDNSSSAGSCP